MSSAGSGYTKQTGTTTSAPGNGLGYFAAGGTCMLRAVMTSLVGQA
jgi:hypothetical protein